MSRRPGHQGRYVGPIGDLHVQSYMGLKQGERIPLHKHDVHHVSYLGAGAMRLTVAGKALEIEAPNFILVDKDHEHELEALEDGTDWLCLFPFDGTSSGDTMRSSLGANVIDPLRET